MRIQTKERNKNRKLNDQTSLKIIDINPGAIVSFVKDRSVLYKVVAVVNSVEKKYALVSVDNMRGRLCSENEIGLVAVTGNNGIIDKYGNEVSLDELKARQQY